MNKVYGGSKIKIVVDEIVEKVNRQALSRGYRAVNALRNATLMTFRGRRSGRKYGNHIASAPGEVPAVKSGALRSRWDYRLNGESTSGGGVKIIAAIESQMGYADYMEHGTPGGKIKPRPFVDKIKEKAAPEISKIYGEPYV